MGKKRFDKKSATTFSVVHRSHEDALYYDNDALRHVFVELPKGHKAGTPAPKKQPPPEEHVELSKNEGFAAQYGIFFDDSKYDYLQHLKPMGQEGGVFIEAEKPPKKKIEDMFKDSLPSATTRQVALDETENIPEELRGFNPDMDPRLREVLEALDDEAYIAEGEGDDEEIFADLLRSGAAEDGELSDYDEWDMDNHQDEFEKYEDYDLDATLDSGEGVALENPYNEGEGPEGLDGAYAGATVNSAWEKDFRRFASKKKDTNDWDSDNDFEDDEKLDDSEKLDAVGALPSILGKKKKKNAVRKKMGAMTDTSSFSMSSSANFRTQGLQLLDDRYEQMAGKFEQSAERNNKEFSYLLERPDLEDMLNEFLGTYELDRGGRRLAKKDAELDAIQQAADSVSKSKLAAGRRKKELAVAKLGSSLGNLAL